MIYVCINIAQLNRFASAISSDGKELMKPFNLQMTLMASNCCSLFLIELS